MIEEHVEEEVVDAPPERPRSVHVADRYEGELIVMLCGIRAPKKRPIARHERRDEDMCHVCMDVFRNSPKEERDRINEFYKMRRNGVW